MIIKKTVFSLRKNGVCLRKELCLFTERIVFVYGKGLERITPETF